MYQPTQSWCWIRNSDCTCSISGNDYTICPYISSIIILANCNYTFRYCCNKLC